ncbi:MAG: ABC transporter permease [Saprospiraceae bacterium]|nr:ABC transporter permease [Saprospiraceae bacterium]
MRTVLLLLQKEFLQIFRNRAMLPIIFVFPIIQLVILSFAATHDVKNIALAVLDQDRSSTSRQLVSKLTASGYFTLAGMPLSDNEGFELIEKDAADVFLTIPAHFERDVLKKQPTQLQVQVNAINGQKAGLAASYAGEVFQSFGSELMAIVQPHFKNSSAPIIPHPSSLIPQTRYWYNPSLDYKTFMVPGILGELVAMLVLILSAMNVVREKEIGTIEQINVTPIRKWQFILGKLLPFLFIGLFDLALGLTVGKLLFNIPLEGELGLVFAFCVANIFCVLGIGFFISNFADTQQQAMFMAWFFMVIFILMSGLFTPIESMPEWAQAMTIPNPIAHFVTVMRLVLLKGSGWADIRYNFYVMIGLGVVFNALAVWTYRKTAG